MYGARRRTLDTQPEKIEVRLSANILKNAMGVGIPGTGMIGLPIAVALGALVGRSEYRLEVLRDVTPEARRAGRPLYRRKARLHLAEGGYRRKTLYRGRSLGRRTPRRGGDRGRTYRLRLSRTRRRGAARQTHGIRRRRGGGEVPLTLRRRLGFRHDGAAR